MDLFSYIKSQISILDLVQEYATLKKAGLYWKGRCPFHHEKTASFTVSPHREIFYCFGCHMGGDAISFIAKIENCSQKEAAQHLLQRYQLTPPPTVHLFDAQRETTAGFKQHEQYNTICKHAALWCHTQLKQNPIAQTYVQRRDISEESINNFTLGYFPSGLQAVKNLLLYMRTQNFLPHDLVEANIVSEGRNVLYSGFEDRIIFPIKDHLGRFCAFGGRIFKEQDQRAKYYNSRENSFFNKGAVLFGLDCAKKKIQETEQVFLVEGYTDCIAMVEAGYPNTVATLGTACTLDHLKQLSRYAQTLYALYDGDKAGQQAIMRLTELCWQVSLELKVIPLSSQEDPASFLNKGNNLQPLIENAQDIFHFFIRTLARDFATKSLQDKMGLTRKCLEAIGNLEEPLKQDILLHRAAAAFNMPIEILKNELNRIKRTHYSPEQTSLATESPSSLGATKNDSENPKEPALLLEKKIFCAIINNIQLLTKDNEQYLLHHLPPPFGSILAHLKNAYDQQHGAVDFVVLFEKLPETHKPYVSKLILQSDEKINTEVFEQLVLQLHKKRWKSTVQAIKAKLANTSDSEERVRITQEFMVLKEKMIQKNRENEGEQ